MTARAEHVASSVSFLRQATAIAAKDLRIEIRGRHALGTLLPFAATLLVSFGFAFGPGRDMLERTAPGLLWMAVLFAAVMAARRAYQAETEDGALEGLLLAPVDKAAVFLGKAAAVALELLALVVAVLLLVVVLFDLSPGEPARAGRCVRARYGGARGRRRVVRRRRGGRAHPRGRVPDARAAARRRRC